MRFLKECLDNAAADYFDCVQDCEDTQTQCLEDAETPEEAVQCGLEYLVCGKGCAAGYTFDAAACDSWYLACLAACTVLAALKELF